MAHILDLSADAILAINPTRGHLCFGRDEEKAEKLRRSLISQWHPDRNSDPKAGHVFDHIKKLYASAKRRFKKNGCSVVFVAPGDKRYQLTYERRFKIDEGTVYVGRQRISYQFAKEFADFALRSYDFIKKFPFFSPKMRKEMEQFLPKVNRHVTLNGGSEVLIMEKEAGYVPLQDVRDFLSDGVPPKHVAWMGSSILNSMCYMEICGFAHSALDVKHMLVDPVNHSIALYGGWWYAGYKNEPMYALPERSMRFAPHDIKHRKRHDNRLDQYLFREVLRELLGKQSIPKPMEDYIDLPPARNPIEDYERWVKVLEESFGKRRFVKLDIDPEDIYAM